VRIWLESLAAVVFATALTPAAAVTINVDFQPTVTRAPPELFTEDYVGTGASPDTGTVWNALGANSSGGDGAYPAGYYHNAASTSYSSLLDSEGNSTSVNISFTATGAFGVDSRAPGMNNIATNAVGLMRDYLTVSSGNTKDVTISGLAAGQGVELWLYGEGDNTLNNRHTSFDANGVTGSTFGDAAAGAALTAGSDYVLLQNVFANGNGEIFISYSTPTQEGPFNGLQMTLVQPVPEPGSAALVGVALAGIVAAERARRGSPRRRRKARSA